MISASECTLSLNNHKILRPKVTKNLTNLVRSFVNSHPGSRIRPFLQSLICKIEDKNHIKKGKLYTFLGSGGLLPEVFSRTLGSLIASGST